MILGTLTNHNKHPLGKVNPTKNHSQVYSFISQNQTTIFGHICFYILLTDEIVLPFQKFTFYVGFLTSYKTTLKCKWGIYQRKELLIKVEKLGKIPLWSELKGCLSLPAFLFVNLFAYASTCPDNLFTNVILMFTAALLTIPKQNFKILKQPKDPTAEECLQLWDKECCTVI